MTQRDPASPTAVGVGPHPRPWPDDPDYDPELLAHGDRRNVADAFRYLRVEAIVRRLDARRHPFHVAVENWRSDPNIGSVVRSANAFLAAAVHVVGRRRWNRRGAMKTEAYQHVHHHPDLEGLRRFARQHGLPIVAIDNVPGALPLDAAELPRRCVLLFGQEGPGLTPEAAALADAARYVRQFGSTRSVNAAVAAGIAMYEWTRRHAAGSEVTNAPAEAGP